MHTSQPRNLSSRMMRLSAMGLALSIVCAGTAFGQPTVTPKTTTSTAAMPNANPYEANPAAGQPTANQYQPAATTPPGTTLNCPPNAMCATPPTPTAPNCPPGAMCRPAPGPTLPSATPTTKPHG